MYRYTSAPPSHHSHTYLHPPHYLHNLTSRSYDTTYMSRPYPYTEPRRYNSYYETTYARPGTSHRPSTSYRPNTSYRPSQTEYWRYVKPVQTQQPEKPPRKSSLKKTEGRHVHFDLPPAQGTSSRTVRIAEEERQRERERVRAKEKEREKDRERDRDRGRERDRGRQRERERESRYIPPRPPLRHHETSDKMPKKQYATYSHSFEYDSQLHHRERYRSSTPPQRTSLPRSNSYYTHAHQSPHQSSQPPLHYPPSYSYHTPLPPTPTVYIITFATDLTPTESSRAFLLHSQLPHRTPPIPHLYTIDARTVRPPSPAMCREYSGVSPRIQDIVMEDEQARYAARKAVERVVRFGEAQRAGASERGGTRRSSSRGGGGNGSGSGMEVSLSVCCHSGTHRSVAIAERIAQCVKSEVGRRGCEEGVRVVCRHVHRVKGRRDPF